jgi:hypothetical protein
MKSVRILLNILICLLGFLPAWADGTREDVMMNYDPVLMGRGGTSMGAEGSFRSFFTNPAGFAEGGSLTLPWLTLWMHNRPEQAFSILENLINANGGSPEVDDFLRNQFTGNGYGLGGSLGIGFIGGGLGLALSINCDAFFHGPTYPANLRGELTSQFDFIAGYAASLRFDGWELAFGADIRPLVRLHALVDPAGAARMLAAFLGVNTGSSGSNPLQGTPALNGSGLAFDAGANLKSGPWTLSASLRDLFGTRIFYAYHDLDEVVKSISRGGLPALQGQNLRETSIPMSMSLGLAFNPDLGMREILDPRLSCELVDPLFLSGASGGSPDAFLRRTRLGLELGLLKFLTLRTGLYQGNWTAGLGMRILALELNCASFGRFEETVSGGRTTAGISLQAVLRF